MFYRYLYHLSIFSFSLALIILAIVYNHFRLHTEDISVSLLDQIEYKLMVMANEFEFVKQDLLYLSDDILIRDFLRTSDKETGIINISTSFKNFIANKKNYDEIVLFNNTGQQLIRVNYNRGKPKTVFSDSKLNKFQQSNFNRTILLKPRQVYLSSMVLNVENNQIETPVKPVIDFSTSVYDPNGIHLGVITIKYLAKKVLNNFKQQRHNRFSQLMLLDDDGYYLSNQNPEYEWSFMFMDHHQQLFSRRFPEVWRHLQVSNKGVIDKENGIFAYTSLSNSPLLQSTQHCEVCSLRAIAYMPSESLKKIMFNEIDKLIPAFIMFFIIGSFALWYLVKNSTRRQDGEQKVALLNNIVKNERDLFINGPTIVFNWRDQFGWPVDYVSDNIKSVLGYSPSSFIDNDLSYSSIVAPEFLSQIADDLLQARQQKLKSFELRPYQVVDANGKRVWLQHFSTAIHDKQENITHYYGYVNDITHIKQTEAELKKSREYVNNLLETLPDPTVVIDVKNFNILLANESAKALYNQGKPIQPGTTCHQLSHHQDTPCDGKDDPCPIQQILQYKKSAKVVHRHFTSMGKEIYVELMSRPVFDENGDIVQIIESQRDITHHVTTERRLTQQATTDPLTDTYNRLKFDNELILQLDMARTNASNLGLIMFDLDNFKMINDTFGHDVGDLVLKDIAGLARDSIRKTDILARWGGEEFMILLPDTQIEVVEKIADNLRQTIVQHQFKETQYLTASFGVTISNIADSDNEIIKRVDNALYKSKNEGKNRVTTLLFKRD